MILSEKMVTVRLVDGQGDRYFPTFNKTVKPGEIIGKVRLSEAKIRKDFEIVDTKKEPDKEPELEKEKRGD